MTLEGYALLELSPETKISTTLGVWKDQAVLLGNR